MFALCVTRILYPMNSNEIACTIAQESTLREQELRTMAEQLQENSKKFKPVVKKSKKERCCACLNLFCDCFDLYCFCRGPGW